MKKLKHIRLFSGFLLVAAIGALLISFIFGRLETVESESIATLIGTRLRDESTMSKSYLLAQSFEDMHTVGIVACAKLTLLDLPISKVFYDSTFRKGCKNRKLHSIIITGLDGNQWQLELIPYVSQTFYFIKWATLVLFTLLLAAATGYLHDLLSRERAKRSALESQKTYLANLAAQVSHDVASPISALKIILEKAPLDADMKLFFKEAVDRTVGICQSLEQSRQSYENVDLRLLVGIIDSEKRLTFKGYPVVKWSGISPTLYLPRNESLRMFSNLFDNAAESGASRIQFKCSSDSQSNIQLIVADDGSEIPDEVVANLGTRGLTVGKIKGSGLGLFQSFQLMKSLNGALDIVERTGNKFRLTFPV